MATTQYPLYSSVSATIGSFLREFKCKSSLFPRVLAGLITVHQNDTLESTFRTLIDKKILSVPVLNEKDKPIGSFGMKDVMNILVTSFKEEDLKDLKDKKNIMDLFASKGLLNRPLQDFPEIGQLEQTFSVRFDEPIINAVKTMVDTRAQRLLVLDSEGRVINIITQSRVVAILSSLLDSFPEANSSLKELGIGMKDVITLPDDISAFQAFKIMRDKNASALGVVNKEGVLVGNVSISDLKLLGYDFQFFNLLSYPLREYLKEVYSPKHREKQIRARIIQSVPEGQSPPSALAVRPSDTLGFTMKLIHMHRVHRYFIVDDYLKPIGVVSLHDILKYIFA